MQVKELMTKAPVACGPNDTMSDAASRMWNYDCGCMPIVSQDGQLIGVITDRDICMAAFTRDQRLSEMSLLDAAATTLATVDENESIDAAMQLMELHRVRRLLVTNRSGKLSGVLSMSDLARSARHDGAARDRPAAVRVVQTLAAVTDKLFRDSSEPR